VRELSAKTELPAVRLVEWIGIARGKYFDWRQRYGKANEHNGLVPRDHWIDGRERQAIVDYFDRHPLEGYRRLTFMIVPRFRPGPASCLPPRQTAWQSAAA
jgi:hypothetical protein